MKIKVLQHHIDEGTRQNAYFCAIALAIREQTGAGDVFVAPYSWVDGKCYMLTSEAKSFMCCFDRGCTEHLYPFEFDLLPVED